MQPPNPFQNVFTLSFFYRFNSFNVNDNKGLQGPDSLSVNCADVQFEGDCIYQG